MSTLAKMCPRWSTIKKQVGDFGAIFVRKHPLAPGLPGQPVSPLDLPVIVRVHDTNRMRGALRLIFLRLRQPCPRHRIRPFRSHIQR